MSKLMTIKQNAGHQLNNIYSPALRNFLTPENNMNTDR